MGGNLFVCRSLSLSLSTLTMRQFCYVFLFTCYVASALNTNVPMCRPNELYTDDGCVPLQHTLADLIREILENPDASMTLLRAEEEEANVTTTAQRVPIADLFLQNLAVFSESNMNECLSLASCNEQCQSWPQRSYRSRRHEEEVADRFLTTAVVDSEAGSGGEEGNTSSIDFVRAIMAGSRRGIEIAKHPKLQCKVCWREFSQCSPLHYNYTVRVNAIYRSMVETNVTLPEMAPTVVVTPTTANRSQSLETLYYYYSMQFLDTANLTTCYAVVSCENTCDIYRTAINEQNSDTLATSPTLPTLPAVSPRPKAIDTIHTGALLGYKFALKDSCGQCRRHFHQCTPDKYVIAKASSKIFNN